MKTQIRSLPIGLKLKLISTTITPDDKAPKAPPKPTNRIAIIDRSGSMYGTIGRVIEDLKKWSSSLPAGDICTIGWFSSPGQYRFLVKGLIINGPKEIEHLGKLLDGVNSTIGTTCFSEILEDLPNVVNELTPISDRFTMIFFTDGCPVVSDVKKEIQAIEKNLKAVEGSLIASIFVGYGDYYNRQLMSDMAQWSKGALIHADSLDKFTSEIKEFTSGTTDSTPRISLPIDSDPSRLVLFYLNGKNPITIDPTVANVMLPAGQETTIYSLTQDVSGKSSRSVDEVDLKGMYGACIALSRINRSDVALDIIGFIGDVFFANKLSNSYTVSEIGVTEELLAEAILEPSKRFAEGRQPGCVPKRDAFCVLDALAVLVDDEEAKFYPGNELFQYRRIGVKRELAEGYAKFQRDEDTPCPMNTLIMNEKRMNLSIQTQIKGKVELTEECANHGLGKMFPTFQYKNYSIVKDGVLNVSILPCSVSEDTFNLLKNQKCIGQTETFAPGSVYAINLGSLPVMNRAIADQYKSAKELCSNLLQSYWLKASVKVLKFFLEQVDPDGQAKKQESILSESAVNYLKEIGITNSGYSPKTVAGEATDTYFAKEFVVSAKGLSSFPKVQEVLDRIASNKKQTAAGEMMLEGVSVFETLKTSYSGPALASSVKEKIDELTKKARSLNKNIQMAKFAVLLGNQWFEEFSSREDCNLEVDGVVFKFEVKEVVEQI